jgi:hypothetical protein
MAVNLCFGFVRLLEGQEESLPWLSNHEQQPHQAHNEPGYSQERQQDSYFKAPQFYCVETICAPCGVVIAWTKFAKAESPTNILKLATISLPKY